MSEIIASLIIMGHNKKKKGGERRKEDVGREKKVVNETFPRRSCAISHVVFTYLSVIIASLVIKGHILIYSN